MLPNPPPLPPPLPTRATGPQVLIYTPDGPLGGTFTCTLCRTQAWQPDLLQHRPDCPFLPGPTTG